MHLAKEAPGPSWVRVWGPVRTRGTQTRPDCMRLAGAEQGWGVGRKSGAARKTLLLRGDPPESKGQGLATSADGDKSQHGPLGGRH